MPLLKNTNHDIDEDVLALLGKEPKYSSTFVQLAEHRCIFLSEVFTKQVAAEVSAWLLHYNHQDPNAPILFYLNSDGGDGAALTNIYDVMKMISAPIKTICMSKCYSAGAFILAAGTKGERYINKNAKVMIHGLQVSLMENDQSSTKTYYKFINDYNNSIMKILSEHTGQPLDKIKEDCKRDMYFDAKEAVAYGLADYVLI